MTRTLESNSAAESKGSYANIDAQFTMEAEAGEAERHHELVSNHRYDSLYVTLRNKLEEAGCFEPAPWAGILSILLVVATYTLGYVTLLTDPHMIVRAGVLLLMAFVSVQAGFVAHEAGDGGITSNRRLAFFCGQIFMTFASGLSHSYWQYFHRIHHARLSESSTHSDALPESANIYEGSALRKLLSSNGTILIAVLVCLKGLSFKIESLRYIWCNRKRTKPDQIFMALHTVLWLVLPMFSLGAADTIINYALVTLFAGPYIGTILILNHVGMQMTRSQNRMPFMERQIMATRNLGDSRWDDFFFGGVNNHIEHHLFPTIPTIKLRRARSITRGFCHRHGLPYSETSYVRALGDVTRYFRRMGRQQLATEPLA